MSDNLWLSTSLDPKASDITIVWAAGSNYVDGFVRKVDLVVGKPVSQTVGGLAARAVDIEAPVSSTRGVLLFDGRDAAAGHADTWGLSPGTKARVFELEVGGNTILVLYSATLAEFPAYQEKAEAIVKSIRFTTP